MKALTSSSDRAARHALPASRQLPSWVTRRPIWKGSPVAGGPLATDELALARRLQVPPKRRLLFAYHLTEDGLADLGLLFEHGLYRIRVPEDAALLSVAALVRIGDVSAALNVIGSIVPWAERLRLTPQPARTRLPAAADVRLVTAREISRKLRTLPEQAQVEAQREALTVWLPFADLMLDLWWQLEPAEADAAWTERAGSTLAEYEYLAGRFTRCSKHRKPKENVAILVAATRELLDVGSLSPRRAGLVRVAVAGMVAARGEPGSDRARTIRETLTQPVTPSHAALASVAADRLADIDPDEGVERPHELTYALTEVESYRTRLPAGEVMPTVVGRLLGRALQAPAEDLVAAGVVRRPGALAELMSQLETASVGAAYADPLIGRLMTASARSHLDLPTGWLQAPSWAAPLETRPWVRGAVAYRTDAADTARTDFRRLARLALDTFPGHALQQPVINALETQLKTLGVEACLVPDVTRWTSIGELPPSFRASIVTARQLTYGTVYDHYYDLWGSDGPQMPAPFPGEFLALCRARAGTANGPGEAVIGAVLEQATILTAGNLAALVAVGYDPETSWESLAADASVRVRTQLEKAVRRNRSGRHLRSAATAWRQALFYLAMAPEGAVAAFLAQSRQEESAAVLARILDGLEHVNNGGRFDHTGTCPGGNRFLAWSATGESWIDQYLQA